MIFRHSSSVQPSYHRAVSYRRHEFRQSDIWPLIDGHQLNDRHLQNPLWCRRQLFPIELPRHQDAG